MGLSGAPMTLGKGVALPGALALLLAVAGAIGLGPGSGGAGGTRVVVDLSASAEPPDPIPGGAILCRDGRLGAAVREAAAEGATRIRLYTDGCWSVPPEPPRIPVDVLLLPRRDNLTVLEVRTPSRIPVGTDFAVEIVVGRTRGPERPPVTAAVTLLRDGERVGAPAAVRLERGATARVLVRDRVDREGLVRYSATVEDPVGPREDDRMGAVARIGERPLVLSIGGPLDVPGMEVVELSATAEVVPDVPDAIVLRGTPFDPSVAEAVRLGAGLVMIGGSGVAGSPVEKVLPLTDRPPEGRAIVLLLDVSGSMDPLLRELGDATEELLSHFAPDDRVAFVAFRHYVVSASPWQRAAGARPQLPARGDGNTLLLPALDAAERLLAEAKGERRLFVISDGKWGDRTSPDLARKLAAFGGMHSAALFVEEDVPLESKALFPVSLTAKDDLAAALKKLEDAAKDRTVASADATRSPAPLWLEEAVPLAGTYRDFPRLYPRGVGETVVLSAGGIPVVAAWRPGGKVVMSATAQVDLAALVRAVLKDTGGIRLRAWREGDGVVAEATGGAGAPFVFGDVSVPARPAGPDRWRATLPRVRTAVEVTCGGAIALVPLQGPIGLGNRRDIAASIAASSGGRVVEERGAGGEEEEEAKGPRAAAVWATLLVAALLVTVSAWRRRRP
jgi:von Willebrand factor type A domain